MSLDLQTQLLDRVRRGDREALGDLLETLRPYVRVIVRSVRSGHRGPGSPGDSDLIQESLMQASQCAGGFQGVCLAEWLGWLRTITVRTTHRILHRQVGPSDVDQRDLDVATLDLVHRDDPCETAIRHENAARVALALSRLPEDMQQVLLARVVDGLDHAAIGAQIGRSSGAVRMLYLRAMRRLREVWQAEFSSVVEFPTHDVPRAT